MRLRIVEALDDIECSNNQEDLIIRFRAENADGTYEEVQTINQILEKIEEEDGEDGEDNIWKFWSIDAHQGPLNRSDPNYKGSSWNV